jgi:hypothetical protein
MEIPEDEAFQVIVQDHWELESVDILDLKSILTDKVKQLISNDFHKLVTILYRLDVSEKVLEEAISRGNVDDSASFLAHKILEREILRYKYRKMYQSKPDDLLDS